MAIALVASLNATLGSGGGTTSALDTTGATLIVVEIGWYSGGGATTGVTDSKGNTYIGQTIFAAGGTSQRLWYCLTPTVGTGHTFTVAGVSSYLSTVVHAFSGVSSYQGSSDVGATTTGSGPLATGSVTPSASGALVVTGRAGNGASTTDSLSPGGFAITTQPGGVGTNVQASLGYYIQSTAAAINPTWSWTPSTPTETAVSTLVFLPAAPTYGRVSQTVVETVTLGHAPPEPHVSQLVAETLTSLFIPTALVSQLVAETLTSTPYVYVPPPCPAGPETFPIDDDRLQPTPAALRRASARKRKR